MNRRSHTLRAAFAALASALAMALATPALAAGKTAPAAAPVAAPAQDGAARAAQKENSKMIKATIHTNKGAITLELDKEKAPVTVDNFVQYAKDGFYEGTIFHRVIDGFMIQGGGLDADMKEKATRPEIKNEAGNGLKNDKYTIAMARRAAPDSASAQFFINVADNDFLNHKSDSPRGFGYAVFGKVVAGQEVVDEIGKVKTHAVAPHDDVPVEPIVITKVDVEE